MDKLKMTFSDCLAEIETIKISYTYLGCLEGHPSLLSKWILEREIEKKEGKNAYLLFDQKTCNDTLGNYRFEIDFRTSDNDYFYLLKLVFFDNTQDLNIEEIINSKTRSLNFKDYAEKINWDDF